MNALAIFIFTFWISRPPRSVRRPKHTPSTEIPWGTFFGSNIIVILAQFSFKTAWFGQHSCGEGSLGAATRMDGSAVRQSPRGSHGGDRQLTWSAGTHTSLFPQPPLLEFLGGRRQFGSPHHKFVHFGLPSLQMQLLQFVSSNSICTGPVPLFGCSGLYGDTEVLFRHTDEGSERTTREGEII